MDLIKCTKINGDPVYIVPHHISAVTKINGQTWIYTDEAPDIHWIVKESVDVVVKMIEGPTMEELFAEMIRGDKCGVPQPPSDF